MIVTLTPEKASELAKLCAETIRKRLIAAEPAVQYASLH